jgi:hypothetical protein
MRESGVSIKGILAFRAFAFAFALSAACSGTPQPQAPQQPPIKAAPECTSQTQCLPYQACAAGSCVALLQPPANLQAAPGTGVVDLSWDTRQGASSYILSAALQEAPSRWVKLGETAGTRAHIFDVPSDTTVYFVVQAATSLGAGPPSAPVWATTALATVQVAGLGTALIVTWRTIQPDPHFDVWRAASAAGPFEKVAARAQTPWAEQGVGDAQTRWYRVRPSVGGADSNVASGTTRPTTPVGLAGTSDVSGTLRFTWLPALAAQSYVVRGTTRSSTFSTSVNDTKASVALTAGGPMRYQAWVSALNDAGESAPSAIIGGLTAPAIVNLAPGVGRVFVTLGSGGEGSIELSRATCANGPWTPFTTVPSSVRDVVDPGPASWTTVWYRAQGIDPVGPGDVSIASLQTYGPPDISNPAFFSGSGCERWATFDTIGFAEQGFTPGVSGTLMGLQASVSGQWSTSTIEAHLLDANGIDLGHATVPSVGGCPQPLSEFLPTQYADFSQTGIRLTAGTPVRLQLRVVGPPGAVAFAGVSSYAYPGTFTAPGFWESGQSLILRTFVKPDPPVAPQGGLP